MNARAPLLPPRLVGLTPGRATSAADGHELARRIGAAAEGGLTGLVLREPLLADGAFLALARLCRAHVAWLALHDRPHLVAAANADAVHLGFRSLTPAEARQVVGDDVAIGFSGHLGDPPELLVAADYSTFGPVYPTASKRGLCAETGLGPLADRCALVRHPVLALGGVTAARVAECRAHGAHGVAAIGALLGAPLGVQGPAAGVSARARELSLALAACEPLAKGGST